MKTPETTKPERPCQAYGKGFPCRDGRDHCFNCGRHLSPEGRCSKKCGEGNAAADDAVNNEEV